MRGSPTTFGLIAFAIDKDRIRTGEADSSEGYATGELVLRDRVERAIAVRTFDDHTIDRLLN